MFCLASPWKGTRDFKAFIYDENWLVEPKLDGIRVGISNSGNGTVLVNRKLQQLNTPPQLEIPHTRSTHFLIDGELLGNTFYAFDYVFPKELLTERKLMLAEILRELDNPFIKAVPFAVEAEHKKKLIKTVETMNGEGVIFKRRPTYYEHGRSNDWIKFKFYHSVDLIVTELMRKGKEQAVSLGWFKSTGVYPEACGCKIPENVLNSLKVGDIIEVRYLGISANNKLIQPCFMRIRSDKVHNECGLNQIQ